MKTCLILFFLCALYTCAYAQPASDSLAYQQERAKINVMLARRTQKFGQYSQSLNMHTGIFGLQTKKDIRRSNDILMDIVKTDDNIYKELKILLEYRTFQQTQVQSHSEETEQNNLSYMNTINKLREQVDQLKAETVKQNRAHNKTNRFYLAALILMLTSILFLITRTSRRKR
jgi:hypothetical protein